MPLPGNIAMIADYGDEDDEPDEYGEEQEDEDDDDLYGEEIIDDDEMEDLMPPEAMLQRGFVGLHRGGGIPHHHLPNAR